MENEIIKPIRPIDVIENHTLPNIIIKSINDLILEKWDGKRANITITEIYDGIQGNVNKKESVDLLILIAEKYKESGWIVKYYTPSLLDDFDSYVVFKK